MKHDKDTTELKKKIMADPDFINSKKYGCSLERFMKRHPNGEPDNIIAVLLCMETEEVKEIYKTAVKKLQSLFRIDAIK